MAYYPCSSEAFPQIYIYLHRRSTSQLFANQPRVLILQILFAAIFSENGQPSSILIDKDEVPNEFKNDHKVIHFLQEFSIHFSCLRFKSVWEFIEGLHSNKVKSKSFYLGLMS